MHVPPPGNRWGAGNTCTVPEQDALTVSPGTWGCTWIRSVPMCCTHSSHMERGDGDAVGAGLSGATCPRQGDFAPPDIGREATWAPIVATAALLCVGRQKGVLKSRGHLRRGP